MENKISKSYFTTRRIVSIGLLSSISIFLGISGLGFIPIPPVNATILHIPVIIGAILEGPVVGMITGLFFGLFSLYQALVSGKPTSFLFINPIISILPRILIGPAAYYIYTFTKKLLKNKFNAFSIGLSSVCASLVNTIGVLGLAYLIYLDRFCIAMNISTSAGIKTILAVALTNGIPEAFLSALISIPIIMAVKKMRKN